VPARFPHRPGGSPAQPPLLDLPALRVLCPETPQLRQLLHLALDHLQRDRHQAYQALATGDHADAGQRLHRLKGAVSMLCAGQHPVLLAFEDVRMAQAAGDTSRMQRAARRLERDLDRLKQLLREALAEIEP